MLFNKIFAVVVAAVRCWNRFSASRKDLKAISMKRPLT